MDDQTLRNQLHHAVETRLSGLQGDPWLAQRVLGASEKRAKKKKKTLCWICDCFDFYCWRPRRRLQPSACVPFLKRPSSRRAKAGRFPIGRLLKRRRS